MRSASLALSRSLRFVLLAAVALTVPTVFGGQNDASEKDKQPDDRAADAQDLILLAPLRPLHVRLHITVDRRPFRKLWRDRIEAAFAESDTDGDGRVTPEQAAKLVASLTGLPGDPARGPAGDSPRPLPADGAAGVSLAALLAHLERIAPPLSVRVEPGVSGTAIFAILDADGDRRLSRAELLDAQRLLLRRDFNDDEAISADELIEDPRAYAREEGTAGGEPRIERSAAAGAVVVLAADTTDASIAASLLDRYDRNRDGRLALKGPEAEVGLEQSALGALPPHADGAISGEQLAALCRRHVDVEIPIALGAGGTSRSAARTNNEGFKIRKRLTGDLKIEGAGIELDLRRNNRNPLRNSGQEIALSDYDADGNGYLDEAESKQSPLFANAFAQMDSDHDGKVVKTEFESYMRSRSQAAGARLVLRVTDRGQDLFDQLDTTPDNQLSVREILAAARLLEIADRNGDGYLGGDEILQRLEWELSRAAADVEDTFRLSTRGAPRGPMLADQTAGPKWFMAMDRNQDGDLSSREFIGPPEAFERLDSNHDGLIDATEAAAAK
jgi:Ca2+-binding EF-hand superfamily protein